MKHMTSNWLPTAKSTGGDREDAYKLSPTFTQFSSVTQQCPALWDPIDCSTPGFPVHHQLLEHAQALVHRVSDVIQPFRPLSSPSPVFNVSQNQGLLHWVSSLHQLAKVLEFELQFPKHIQDWFPLGSAGLISCSWRDSQEPSPIPQFKSINSLALSFLYGPALTYIHDYWKSHN